jgi:NitT/TauT family transport system substrate-binding protein
LGVAAGYAPALADLGRALRVGDAPGDPFAQAYWANDTGIFQRVGLNVEISNFTSGSAMSAGVIGGALDIAVTTPIQVANAHLHGVPLVIIAPGSINTPKAPSTVMISLPSGVRAPKDLEGKTVAVNSLKTLSEVGLDAWLSNGGVDPANVHIVEMTMPAMGPAISRGAIAAGILNDPSLSAALRNDGARVVLDTNLSIAPRLMGSCWFCTQSFAAANPDIVRKFAEAMLLTARWANTHKSESAEILAKYGRLEVNVVKSGLRSEFAEELHLADIQPELDAAAKFGSIAGHVNAADLIFDPRAR